MTNSDSIAKLSKTINLVKTNLTKNNPYSIWISFSIGPLTLCTGSSNYSLMPNNSNKVFTNLIMSLEYSKNGSGQANSFTLEIAYTPDILNVSRFRNDINYIDKVLSYYRECTIQYGYSIGGRQILSPKYSGSVLDFEVSIENQIINYTITGYSSIVSITEAQHNYPRFCIEQEDSGEKDKDGKSKKVNVVHTYNKNGKIYNSKTYEDIVNDQNAIDLIKLASMALNNAIGKDTNYKYDIIVEDDVGTCSVDEVEAVSGVSIFEYVNTILSQATDTVSSNSNNNDEDTSNIELAERVTYSYRIDDRASNKSVTIFKYDPTKDKQDIDIVFEVCGKSTIVKSFSTSFKGSVLSALVGTQANNSDKPANIDEDGELLQADSLLNTTPVGNIDSDSKSESSNWANAVHHCYKATLTTMGIPCEIPINTKFNIVPTIYGQQHHTGGIYSCIKVTDNISNSGFNTTMELIKLSSDEVKNYKKSLKNDADSSKLGIIDTQPNQSNNSDNNNGMIQDRNGLTTKSGNIPGTNIPERSK